MTQRRGWTAKPFWPCFGLDDLDGDGCGRADAVSPVGVVGEAVGQERPQPAGGAQERDAAVAVVQVGGGDGGDPPQTTVRIGQRVAPSRE